MTIEPSRGRSGDPDPREIEIRNAYTASREAVVKATSTAKHSRHVAEGLRDEAKRTPTVARDKLDAIQAAAVEGFYVAVRDGGWLYDALRREDPGPIPGDVIAAHFLIGGTTTLAERLNEVIDRLAEDPGTALLTDRPAEEIEKEIKTYEARASEADRDAEKAELRRDNAAKAMKLLDRGDIDRAHDLVNRKERTR